MISKEYIENSQVSQIGVTLDNLPGVGISIGTMVERAESKVRDKELKQS